MIPFSAKVWGARVVLVSAIVLLCWLAGSGIPSWALAIAWSPNGLFVVALTRGVLRMPRALETVRPIEPVIYRWLGVGLVKHIVANRVWPAVHGLKLPPTPKKREEFLKQIELNTKGAEICHAATFVLASCVALVCLALGSTSLALWIVGFNVVLNLYPVMLQRSNRWRMQQGRARGAPDAVITA